MSTQPTAATNLVEILRAKPKLTVETRPMITLYGKHSAAVKKTQQIFGVQVQAICRLEPGEFYAACRRTGADDAWKGPRLDIRCAKDKRKEEFEKALEVIGGERLHAELIIANPRRKGTVDNPVRVMNRVAVVLLIDRLGQGGMDRLKEVATRLRLEPYIIARLEAVPVHKVAPERTIEERVRELLRASQEASDHGFPDSKAGDMSEGDPSTWQVELNDETPNTHELARELDQSLERIADRHTAKGPVRQIEPA